ncbi:MAG: Gfo/Idh/MocA family oxidoreductase [Verrucomicrobiota bacterium]
MNEQSASKTPAFSRRQFNRGGLAAVLGACVAPSIQKGAAQEHGSKLGLAIVGVGGYATGNIAPEIESCSHVQFNGVVTGNPDTKGKEWAAQYGFEEDAIYTYDTVDRLADDDRIDLVHIALPNSMHAEFAIKCAKAGKHVMVEKPMAISSEECEAMIAAAKEAGVLLGVNYRLHWEPHHLKAIDLIANGAIGDIACGNYEFSWGYARALTGPNKDKIKKWLLDPKMAGGGALFDTGVYPIQAACYLTGAEPVSVRGFQSKRHPELFPDGVEETMSFEMLFEDGFQALCRASYSQSFHQCTTLGDKGSIEIKPGIRANGRPGSVFGQSGGGLPNPKSLFLNIREIKADQTLQQAMLLDAFASAIKGGESTFKTSGEMGLRDVRIAEKVYESVANGGVSVPVA